MMKHTPRGWEKDSLTTYLEAVRNNQFATFANRPDDILPLINIDGLYRRFLEGAINPRPFVPMGFLLRAHSAYRCAAGAVMAGQVYEAQAHLRLCMEHAAYGVYIGNDNGRWSNWMSRHDSDTARAAVRKEFTVAKIRNHMEALSGPIAARFSELYDTLINFGAHPNERGFSQNSAIQKAENGDVHFQTIYLQGDGVSLEFGLRTAAEVGTWSLQAAQLLYPGRFGLLGIRDELNALRKQFWGG